MVEANAFNKIFWKGLKVKNYKLRDFSRTDQYFWIIDFCTIKKWGLWKTMKNVRKAVFTSSANWLKMKSDISKTVTDTCAVSPMGILSSFSLDPICRFPFIEKSTDFSIFFPLLGWTNLGFFDFFYLLLTKSIYMQIFKSPALLQVL